MDLMNLEELVSQDDTAPAVGQDPAGDPFSAVPAALRGALVERGFTELTSVQRAVLDAEVEGHDLKISSQTGSGKTVALGFVLAPKLVAEGGGHGPDALIIVPTRELATQVCNELEWLMADIDGVRLASVTGGTPLYRDRQILSRRPRILVGTPGRLLDHVRNGVLDLSQVSELVLDEADQMLDMGFREELEDFVVEEVPRSAPEGEGEHCWILVEKRGVSTSEAIRRLARRLVKDPRDLGFAGRKDARAVARQWISAPGVSWFSRFRQPCSRFSGSAPGPIVKRSSRSMRWAFR